MYAPGDKVGDIDSGGLPSRNLEGGKNFGEAVYRAGDTGAKAGRHNPVISLSRMGIPVPREYERLIARKGWDGVFCREAWTKYPLAAGALYLNMAFGAGANLARRAAGRAAEWMKAGRLGETVLGVVDGIKADKDGGGWVSVRMPVTGGGEAKCSFSIKGHGEIAVIAGSLGRGIEVVTCGGNGDQVALRPIPGETVAVEGGGIKRLSVYEAAAVVDAQYKDLGFAGEWVRTPLKSARWDGAGGGVSLYVHARTRQGILVFRGTEPLSAMDWATNIATTHGKVSRQYKDAVTAAEEAGAAVGDIIMAGHSKGGGMVQYASAKTGIFGITFNTVGLPCGLIGDGGNARCSHYMTRYDWVGDFGGGRDGTGIAGPLAALRGKSQRTVGGVGNVHLLRAGATNRYLPLDLHSMDSMKRGLRLDPKTLIDPFSSRGGARALEIAGAAEVGKAQPIDRGRVGP